MPSRLVHRREATAQSIKTTTEPRFTLKGVPMPPVMKTFLRRLSGDRLFPKKPQATFGTNYTSRSSISTSTPSPNSSAIFSYESDGRAFTHSSGHLSEINTPTPPPFNINKEIKKVSELYSAALEEMRFVEDSKGTNYYREDHETARKAIEECMRSYESLLNILLCETDRNEVRDSLASKLQNLEAQFNALPSEIPRDQ